MHLLEEVMPDVLLACVPCDAAAGVPAGVPAGVLASVVMHLLVFLLMFPCLKQVICFQEQATAHAWIRSTCCQDLGGS